MTRNFYVKAVWDAEASVWTSETDVPGLVIEAETLEEFERSIVELVPEMLSANADLHNARVGVNFTSMKHSEFAVA